MSSKTSSSTFGKIDSFQGLNPCFRQGLCPWIPGRGLTAPPYLLPGKNEGASTPRLTSFHEFAKLFRGVFDMI